MYNVDLVKHLDQLADRYIVANDLARSKAFRAAARNIELLYFPLNKENLPNVSFKGLGNSIKAEITEFITTNSSQRSFKLYEQYPPIDSLKLLNMPNMDIETIKHLWQLAKSLPTPIEPSYRSLTALPHSPPGLLGDCVVHTDFGLGNYSNQQLISSLLERGYKHIFLADFNLSPNTLGGLSESNFIAQTKEIKELQLQNNVRIWQGLILDVDLDGTPIGPTSNINSAEFLVVKASTRPHTNITSRIASALNKLPHKPTMVDCIDHHHHTLNIEQLKVLASRATMLLSHSSVEIAQFLKKCHLPRIAFGSYSKTLEELDYLLEYLSLMHEINVNSSQVVNFLPRPFLEKAHHTSIAGVRSTPPLAIQADPMKKIEATLARINELRDLHINKYKHKDKSSK